MHLLALALALAFGGTPTIAAATDATPPAPAADPASGATAQMNVPFALDYYNIRIQKIEWCADGTPTYTKLQLSPSDQGLGTLVITADVKANGSDSSHVVPTSSTQLIYKDGSSSTEENLQPYTLSGRQLDGSTYQAGDGGTVMFILTNMTPPTADNPVTKIVFSQSWEDLQPKLIRLLNPTIAIVR